MLVLIGIRTSFPLLYRTQIKILKTNLVSKELVVLILLHSFLCCFYDLFIQLACVLCVCVYVKEMGEWNGVV